MRGLQETENRYAYLDPEEGFIFPRQMLGGFWFDTNPLETDIEWNEKEDYKPYQETRSALILLSAMTRIPANELAQRLLDGEGFKVSETEGSFVIEKTGEFTYKFAHES